MGTEINDLMRDITNNKLTSEENTMVDSIISDMNTETQAIPQQHKMPQLTDEERQMLMKQEQHERQMMMERQQMAQQQQHIQQQQLHQRKQMQEMREEQNKIKEESFSENIKKLFYDHRGVVIILLLSLFFNTDSVDNYLRFKDVPFFYDIQFEKSKLPYVLLKSCIIAILFCIVYYFVK